MQKKYIGSRIGMITILVLTELQRILQRPGLGPAVTALVIRK